MMYAKKRLRLHVVVHTLAVVAAGCIIILASKSATAQVTVSDDPCTLGDSTILNGLQIRAYASPTYGCSDSGESIIRTCVNGTLDDTSGTGRYIYDTCSDADLTFGPVTRYGGTPMVATPGEWVRLEARLLDVANPDHSFAGGAVSNDTHSPVGIFRRPHHRIQITDQPDGGGEVIYDPSLLMAGNMYVNIDSSLATAMHSWLVPDDVGMYSVRFCADQSLREPATDGRIYNNMIPETDETNNCGPWTNLEVSDTPCSLGGSTIENGEQIRAYADNTNACLSPANSIVRTCVNGTLDDTSGTGQYVYDTCTDADLTMGPVTSITGGILSATPGVQVQFVAEAIDLNNPTATSVGGAVSNQNSNRINRNFYTTYEISDGTIKRTYLSTAFTRIERHTFPSAGTYSIRACADQSDREFHPFSGLRESNLVPETDETNNCGPWTNVEVSNTTCSLGGSTIENGGMIRAYASTTNGCASGSESIIRTCINGTLDDTSGTGRYIHDTCTNADLAFVGDVTNPTGGPLTATPGVEVSFQAQALDLNRPSWSVFGGAFSNDSWSPVHTQRTARYTWEVADGAGGTGNVVRVNSIFNLKLGSDSYDLNQGRYTFPSAGTYSLRFCADQSTDAYNNVGRAQNNAVPETDETNNCGDWLSVIIPPEIPDASAATVTPGLCGTGQLTIDWPDAPGAASYSIYNADTGDWVGNSIGSDYTYTGMVDETFSLYLRANSSDGLQSEDSDTITGSTAPACPLSSFNLTTSGADCAIPVGDDRCTIDLGWEFINLNSPYNIENITTSEQISTGATGTNVPAELTIGTNNIVFESDGTRYEDITLNADCAGGSAWDADAGRCELVPPPVVVSPPTISITPEITVLRPGDTTTFDVTIDHPGIADCRILSAQDSEITFTHDGTVSTLATYSYTTKEIFNGLTILVQCEDASGTITSKESRLEVVPRMQEI